MDIEGQDYKLSIIKDKLNDGKIKLWLPPFQEDGNCNAKELKALANLWNSQLTIPEDDIFKYLVELQEKAVENFKNKECFQNSGLATLKVRPPKPGENVYNVKIQLCENGKMLRENIAGRFQLSPEKLKMICKGRVLIDEDSLENQGVKHGVQIMTLVMTTSPEEVAAMETDHAMVDETKRDANLLAKEMNEEGETYLQIADQTGKPLNLPKREGKALVVAMTFHEKGRAALKSEHFERALIFLLEAEKEFGACNSKLLEQVDNYGLLSLDLAWCYLNLQSLSQLPNAQCRLERCEKVFHKSYGPNLERLIAVKGSSGNERALFLRLHLLQAIVFYHQGKIEAAKELFQKVGDELKSLKVDDKQLNQLVELGYTVGESRLALRESQGDVQLAVGIINTKREERKALKELEKKKRAENKERMRLGKCSDGSWVEPQFVKSLISMGYSKKSAIWALKEANNRIAEAVDLIQREPERVPTAPDDDSVQQLLALGFDETMVNAALRLANGNIIEAAEKLTENNGVIPGECLLDSDSAPGTSKKRDPKLAEDAFSRISEGIANEEEDHLDLPLTAEENFLKQYQELLGHH